MVEKDENNDFEKQKLAAEQKTLDRRQKLQDAVNQLIKIDWTLSKDLTQEQIEKRLNKINTEQNNILTDTDIADVAKAACKLNELKANGKSAVITYVPNLNVYGRAIKVDFNSYMAKSALMSAPGIDARFGQAKQIKWLVDVEDDEGEKTEKHFCAVHLTPGGDTGAASDGRGRFYSSDCHIFGHLGISSIPDFLDAEKANCTNFSAVVIEGKNDLNGLTYDFLTGIPVHPLVKNIEQLQTMYSKNSLLYTSVNSLEKKLHNLNSIEPVAEKKLLESAKIPDDQWPTYSNMNIRKNEKGNKITIFQKLEPSMATLSIILDRDWNTAGKIVAPSFEPTKLYLKDDIKLASQTIEKGEIEDTKLNALFGYVQQKYGFARMTMIAFKSALQQVANKNKFNPIADWMSSFRGLWDGQRRIDTFFHDYFGVVDTPETREACRLMFVTTVLQAFHPGVSQNYSWDLIGGQGIGKTTAFQKLSCSMPGLAKDNPLGQNDFLFAGSKNTNSLKGLDPLLKSLSGKLFFQDDEMATTQKMTDGDLKELITSSKSDRDVKYAEFNAKTERTWVMIRTSNSSPDGIYTMAAREGTRRFIPIICTLDRDKNKTLKVADRTNLPGDNRHILNYDDVKQIWAEAINAVDNCHRLGGDNVFVDNKSGKVINQLSQNAATMFATIYQDLLRTNSIDQDLILYVVDHYNETGQMLFTKTDLNDFASKAVGKSIKMTNKIDMDMTKTLAMDKGRRRVDLGMKKDIRQQMDSGNGETTKVPRKRGYIITDMTKEICHEDSEGTLYAPIGGVKHALVIMNERHHEMVEEQQKQEAQLKLYIEFEQQEEFDDWQATTEPIKIHAITKMMLTFAAEHDVALVDSTFDFPNVENRTLGIDNSDSLPFDIDEPATVKHQS